MTELKETNRDLLSQQEMTAKRKSKDQLLTVMVPASSTIELFNSSQAQAIDRIMLNIEAREL